MFCPLSHLCDVIFEEEKNIQGEKKPFPISLNNRSRVLGELFQQVRTGGNSHLGLDADYIFLKF